MVDKELERLEQAGTRYTVDDVLQKRYENALAAAEDDAERAEWLEAFPYENWRINTAAPGGSFRRTPRHWRNRGEYENEPRSRREETICTRRP